MALHMVQTLTRLELQRRLKTQSLLNFSATNKISRGALYSVVKGDRTPTIETLRKLSIALGLEFRGVVLEEYCDGAARSIGETHPLILYLILRENRWSLKLHPDSLKLGSVPQLDSLKRFEARGVYWHEQRLTIVDLVLAAYLHECPIREQYAGRTLEDLYN